LFILLKYYWRQNVEWGKCAILALKLLNTSHLCDLLFMLNISNNFVALFEFENV
jgi:hypothetical protein